MNKPMDRRIDEAQSKLDRTNEDHTRNLKPAAPDIVKREKIVAILAAVNGMAKSLRLFADTLENTAKVVTESMVVLMPEVVRGEDEEGFAAKGQDYDGDSWPVAGSAKPHLHIDLSKPEYEQCCTDDCCGPGSWCCARANQHEHDPDTGDLIDKARADKAEQDMLADEERN